jgi:hypothetical protein
MERAAANLHRFFAPIGQAAAEHVVPKLAVDFGDDRSSTR